MKCLPCTQAPFNRTYSDEAWSSKMASAKTLAYYANFLENLHVGEEDCVTIPESVSGKKNIYFPWVSNLVHGQIGPNIQ